MKFYYTYTFGEIDTPYDCESFELYDTLDKVCDQLDHEIKAWIGVVDDDKVYSPPDRKRIVEKLERNNFIKYWEFDVTVFMIKKMRVAELMLKTDSRTNLFLTLTKKMTAVDYYREDEDEDPCNIVEDDEEYEDPEEKAELIRMINLALIMKRNGIEVAQNKTFSEHIRVTRFLKYVGTYVIQHGYKKNLVPSALKRF